MDVLRRLQRQGLEIGFGAGEHPLGIVDEVEHAGHPGGALFDAATAQAGETFEDAFEDHDRQERLGRMRSRMSGSAKLVGQLRVSMMWLSAP